jgi:hypothetical protein
LVIAQSRAEGAQRILLVVPKSLIGQWQSELLNLFGIQARENDASFVAPGVYLVGREFAGSEGGATPLGAAPPFDLAVIDEAHEIFAGRRYQIVRPIKFVWYLRVGTRAPGPLSRVPSAS